MFSTLRMRFGIPGVISVIALVFAMFGGAYAASNSSNNGKATASAKAKKGPRGPKGATGPAGPQGPAGPAGANGSNGTNGTNGTSAEAVSFAGAKGGCTEGGAEVKSAKPAAFVCNGSPWTAGGTLPSGKTETGNWSAVVAWPEQTLLPFQISYNIPLGKPSENVVFLNATQTENSKGSGKCELVGTGLTSKPVAPPGYLCVFTRLEEFGTEKFIGLGLLAKGDTPAGATVWVEPTETLPEDFRANMSGTWAVTAK